MALWERCLCRGGREQANKVKNGVMGSMWERGQRSSMYREDVHACTYVGKTDLSQTYNVWYIRTYVRRYIGR